MTDPAELARLRELPLQAWAPGARDRYVRLLLAVLTAAGRGQLTEQALAVMLEGYLSRAATGRPVHTWPWPAETRHALLRRGEAPVSR